MAVKCTFLSALSEGQHQTMTRPDNVALTKVFLVASCTDTCKRLCTAWKLCSPDTTNVLTWLLIKEVHRSVNSVIVTMGPTCASGCKQQRHTR